MTRAELTLHASAVAHNGHGLLITGRTETGKSALSIEMIALGAVLVSDDRTRVLDGADGPVLSPPETLAGLIELRGIGLIRLPFLDRQPLRLIADLDHEAEKRLPEPAYQDLAGHRIRRIYGRGRPGLAAALMAVLAAGEILPTDVIPAPVEDERD